MENEKWTAKNAIPVLDVNGKIKIKELKAAQVLARSLEDAGYHVIWSGNAKTGYTFRKRG